MRAVLPFALMLALAGAVEAQERPQEPEQVQATQQFDGPRAGERAPALKPPTVPVQPAVQDANETPAEAGQRALQTRAVEAMDAQERGPATVQWWWLVAAIVVAGVIIVAVT